ncbi:MAG: EAL domain-containing protein [Gammaproteobacteria bacterium]|nr:EAL domain-containing protein [Gammaproteobacteria bacterium]
MEKKILRLLIVDDSPDDAEIVTTALSKGNYMLKSLRVHDLTGLQAAIEKGEWDAVVAEYQLPHFGAALVLEWLRRAQLDIPLLVLTRAIRDADLLKIMRAGARDVVLKSQPARLLPAIERELAVAHERALYRQATKSLKEMEDKHRAVIESAREAICYSQDGMHINANKPYLDMFEYEDQSELEGVPLMNLIDKADQTRFKEYVRKTGNKAGAAQEFLAVRKGGACFHVEVTLSPIMISGEACTQVLVTDVSKRRAVETKLRYLNEHDPLTGLYNRHYFLQELTRTIERAKSDGGTSGGIVYVDFHDLRRVSKTHGHTAADRFLLAAARILREIFGERAVLTRCGDHEFAALLASTQTALLRDLAHRAEQALNATSFDDDGTQTKCNCRLASALIDRTADNGQKILANLYHTLELQSGTSTAAAPTPAATAAPTTAAPSPTKAATVPSKPTTKPAVTAAPKPATAPAAATSTPAAPSAPPILTTPSASATAVPTEGLERLQWAIQQEAFELNYQPIINLHGDPAEYFEVLVRMIDPNEQRIPPGQFMPLAEQTGLANTIDRWVLRHAIRALADLHRQDRRATFFINLSANALNDVEMVVMLQRWLNENVVRGQHLILELEEAAMLAHAGPAAAFMRAAKRVGCGFCLDNFGRNLATLNQWQELPIDYFKIDSGLVSNVHSDNAIHAALKRAVEAVKKLDRKTVAKGVESAGALSVLWTLGVDYAQGHYFQQAESAPDYEFENETTLSSEDSPHWATTKTKSR